MAILGPKRLQEACRTIMVSSGKGGVGKSTIATNLAVGLARLGKRVGLLDLDLFGPSIPRLMGLQGQLTGVDQNQGLIPMQMFGVQCMSMGLLIDPDNPVVWRGLMVMKGVQQLIWQVRWGHLDFLVLDMPPGTGDCHLTVCQQLIIDSALIVTTPQLVALSAAEKGIQMLKKMQINISGIVENMKWMECSHCFEKNFLFPNNTNDLSVRYNIPILTGIPMDRRISENSDRGEPLTAGTDIPEYYQVLVDRMAKIDIICTKTNSDQSGQ